jgi:hypothetical protein
VKKKKKPRKAKLKRLMSEKPKPKKDPAEKKPKRVSHSEKPGRPKPGFKRQRTRSEAKRDNYERTLFTKVWEGRSWRLIVGVYSYKGGKPKLMITREHASRKYMNAPFAKLGRFSKEEVLGIMPLMTEAMKHMR